MKVKLFTHTDLDGVGSAVIAKNAFPDLYVTYCDYSNVNEKVSAFLYSGAEREYGLILITDISVNEDVAHALDAISMRLDEVEGDNSLDGKVWLLDHHPTAIWMNKYHWACVSPEKVTEEELDGDIVGDTVTLARTEKTSGTSMLFDFLDREGFLKGIPVIKRIELMEFAESVRRFDTWDWKTVYNDGHARDLNNLLYLVGRERFFNRFSIDPDIAFRDEEQLLLDIDNENYKKYLSAAKKRMVVANVAGYTAGVLYATKYVSELGNDLSETYSDLDFIVLIDSEHSKISYRTTKENIDLGEFAKKFGGGGHPKASGSRYGDTYYLQNFIDLYFNENETPLVEIVTTESGDDWVEYETIDVRVNGRSVGGGTFGGEPEDNTRHRDYSWVDGTISNLANSLGANVEFKNEN